MSADSTAWVTSEAPSTNGSVTDNDEYLHGGGPDGDALTETWYWGFNVPEARINCYAAVQLGDRRPRRRCLGLQRRVARRPRPETPLARALPRSADKAFKDGWVRRDGRTIRLVHASKRVEREPGTLRPTRIAVEMHDAEGGAHTVTGEVVAGLPWGGWHNMNCHLGLVRWELDGRVGWGDSMDVQWNDYVWRYGQTETD